MMLQSLKKISNATNLKILAILLMFLDHIYEMFGAFGAPMWLTMLGRIVFPLFMFLVADSFYYTHNRKAYLKRLLFMTWFMIIGDMIVSYFFTNGQVGLANNAFGAFFLVGISICAWDLMVEGMKEKKLLRALGNVDNQYIKEAEPMKKTSKITNRQKWVSVAACFVLVAVIGVGVFQSNLFGTKNDIATLDGGETITFVKNDLSQSSINLNVTTRPLSDAEIEMLFADLPVTADAYFDADNHNILGLEGKIGDTRMVVSKQGVNLLDTIIDGNTITSSVDGVDINAGYFVTKSNSQGIKTVIYYATFDMGENTIYVEYSGVENESETVKNNLVDTILKLIENGAFDLSQIQE